MDIDYDALEKQVVENHERYRQMGGIVDPIQDCDVYYITRMLFFTSNVLVIPMRDVTDKVVVSGDKTKVWYEDEYHRAKDDCPEKPSLHVLDAHRWELLSRHKDKSRLHNVKVGTTSRHIGVGAMSNSDPALRNIIVFAPFAWLFTPATDEGYGVSFRCGITTVGTEEAA